MHVPHKVHSLDGDNIQDAPLLVQNKGLKSLPI